MFERERRLSSQPGGAWTTIGFFDTTAPGSRNFPEDEVKLDLSAGWDFTTSWHPYRGPRGRSKVQLRCSLHSLRIQKLHWFAQPGASTLLIQQATKAQNAWDRMVKWQELHRIKVTNFSVSSFHTLDLSIHIIIYLWCFRLAKKRARHTGMAVLFSQNESAVLIIMQKDFILCHRLCNVASIEYTRKLIYIRPTSLKL